MQLYFLYKQNFINEKNVFENKTFVFKLFKLVEILTNLLMSRLLTSVFKAIKSLSAPKLDVSISLVSFNSF